MRTATCRWTREQYKNPQQAILTHFCGAYTLRNSFIYCNNPGLSVRMEEWDECSSPAHAVLLHMQFSRTAFTVHHFLFVKAVQAEDLHAVQYFLSFCGKSRRSACRSHPPTFGSVDLLFFCLSINNFVTTHNFKNIFIYFYEYNIFILFYLQL